RASADSADAMTGARWLNRFMMQTASTDTGVIGQRVAAARGRRPYQSREPSSAAGRFA
ncbi:MAG: hypothetical protein QOF46_2816, partial [Paraburkholderia sp.]|nr:hypothetical protein [Paraburkholderia sp.]